MARPTACMPGYPEAWKRNHDNGESTFDKFRSDQQVPVGPQGSMLQRVAESQTYNEREEEMIRRERGFSSEWGMRRMFDEQMGPGGSTFALGNCDEEE